MDDTAAAMTQENVETVRSLGMVFATEGNLYIAGLGNFRIRMVDRDVS